MSVFVFELELEFPLLPLSNFFPFRFFASLTQMLLLKFDVDDCSQARSLRIAAIDMKLGIDSRQKSLTHTTYAADFIA